MHDWKEYVRQHLHLSGFRVERETEIVEEVAQQLHEVYSEALRNGLTEAEAQQAVERHIPDWETFASNIVKSLKEADWRAFRRSPRSIY